MNDRSFLLRAAIAVIFFLVAVISAFRFGLSWQVAFYAALGVAFAGGAVIGKNKKGGGT